MSHYVSLDGTILLTILWSAMGYYVYGGMGGITAMAILGVLYSISIAISFIPYVGVFIQGWVMIYQILPWVQDFTHIGTTWLTDIMLFVNLGCGVILWCIVAVWVTLTLRRYFGWFT
ncbi:MAG: hypothetical protein PHO90_01250 [Candidatus Pacebacteria bacterium]|nr:hypothetical protein [Candidatus Paceibacterota bacterium]